MSIFTLLMIAVGLSMDAFAVSVASGMASRNLRAGEALFIALTFGLFQGIMPLAGYLACSAFSSMIRSVDHWVALILLGTIGIKMIRDALCEKGEAPKAFSCRLILLQGVATSIDALTMGVSFAAMQVQIGLAASLIAGVTLVCCLAGVRIGKRCHGLLQNRAQLFGGCILLLIGVKIFLEHLLSA